MPARRCLVSAWAADVGVLLGQRKVDGKSNEITAIPELLRLLQLKGLHRHHRCDWLPKRLRPSCTGMGRTTFLSLSNQPHVVAW